MNAPVDTVFVGGPLDGEHDTRDAEDLPGLLGVWLRTPMGASTARYQRRNEPDTRGRVVYRLVMEGVPVPCRVPAGHG